MLKFLLALLDWTFIPHGYILNGYPPEIAHLVKQFKCKECSNTFLSVKKNNTCHSIKCFIRYRINRRK